MKKPRFLFWLIVVLALSALVVDFPKVPVKFNVGKYKVDTLLAHPRLNLEKIGLPISSDLEPKLGLDLQGGTHLVLEADTTNIKNEDRKIALESLKTVVERRVNLYGVSEALVQTSIVGDSHRILVELPGVSDVSSAIKLIGQTAKLDFRELPATASASLASQTATLDQYVSTDLGGQDLQKASPVFSTQTGKPEVQLQFTQEGGKKFEEITKRNVGKPLAIFLDDEIVSAPTVQSVITGGSAVINGQFTAEQSKQLSVQLNAGALPTSIKVIEQRNIGPTLGQESINASLIAGGVGLIVVAAFMIFMYGRYGLIADFALIIYSLLVFAVFKLIPVTLTLAGIAGFILSIGMAVDANILIFERMKEEIRWGKTKEKAIEAGFLRAWSSIRDSNISSLITAAILYYFGSGIVRGFAVTLAIGILFSMFSSITVSRTFLRYFLKNE
ncbi:MAG TPA: protein translocase subunit SecD [Patescibacteria group bacterium]